MSALPNFTTRCANTRTKEAKKGNDKMKTRAIDNMSKEDIINQLLRMASYLRTTYELDAKEAGKETKTPHAARTQGAAIGRREMCARIGDDLAVTFGIEI